jgi:hypothetical protein
VKAVAVRITARRWGHAPVPDTRHTSVRRDLELEMEAAVWLGEVYVHMVFLQIYFFFGIKADFIRDQ